jgi:hypothetical protein
MARVSRKAHEHRKPESEGSDVGGEEKEIRVSFKDLDLTLPMSRFLNQRTVLRATPGSMSLERDKAVSFVIQDRLYAS